MDLNKEKFIAYCAAIALFVVGVVCYAAFPDKTPEKPVRAMLNAGVGAMGGRVLFTHKNHSEREQFGLECIDCHHKWVEAESEKPTACRECHKVKKEDGDDERQPKLSDALHQRCYGCHEDTGHGPGQKDCSGCHGS